MRDELLTKRHADNNLFRFFVGDMSDNAYMEEALTGANFLLYLPVIPRPFDCDVAPAQTTVFLGETVAEVLHTSTDFGVEKTVVVSPSRPEPLEKMPDMLAALMEAVVVAEGRYLGKDAKTAIICIRHDGAFIDLVDYSFGNASNADLIVQNKVAFRCVPCESFDFSR